MEVVFIALGGDQRLDSGRFAGVDVSFAEVTRVGQALLGLVEALGQVLQLLEHRRHLLLVVGRLHDLRHQHQHGVGIDDGLGVVALLEAAPGNRHDPRFFVSEVDLVIRARAGRRRLGWLATRLLAAGGGLGGTGDELGLIVGLLAGKALGGSCRDLGLGRGDGGPRGA